MGDDGLRDALLLMDSAGRDRLRRVLIADHADRDRTAEALLRGGNDAADRLAEIIDHLTQDRSYVGGSSSSLAR